MFQNPETLANVTSRDWLFLKCRIRTRSHSATECRFWLNVIPQIHADNWIRFCSSYFFFFHFLGPHFSNDLPVFMHWGKKIVRFKFQSFEIKPEWIHSWSHLLTSCTLIRTNLNTSDMSVKLSLNLISRLCWHFLVFWSDYLGYISENNPNSVSTW